MTNFSMFWFSESQWLQRKLKNITMKVDQHKQQYIGAELPSNKAGLFH